jgi:MFS family permease
MTGLLRLPTTNRFPALWSSLTISALGDQLTLVAIPTLAILGLGAGPLAVGALAAAGWLAWPILAVPAGVWVDRLSRRQVLVACDVVRALALLTIPLAAVTVGVSLPLLLAVVAIAGVASVFSELAFSANVADLLPASEIPVANVRLEASRSTSYLAGPGIAGVLIGALGAATVVLVDAASFVASGLLILRTPARSPMRAAEDIRAPGFRRELREGWLELRRQPLIVRFTLAEALSNLGLVAARAVLLLFLYRTLSLSPAEAGLALSGAGVGALLGVAASGRLTARFGVGRMLRIATVAESASFLLVPVAGWLPLPALGIGIALGASSFWGLTWNVVAGSVRQVVLPNRLQGRVAAITRTVGYGVIPIGSVLGGLIGQGLSPLLGSGAFAATIAVGALVGVASDLALVGSRMNEISRWQFDQPWPGPV